MTGKEGSLEGDYREILSWEMDKLNVIFVLCIPPEDGQYRLINLLKSLILRTLRSLRRILGQDFYLGRLVGIQLLNQQVTGREYIPPP